MNTVSIYEVMTSHCNHRRKYTVILHKWEFDRNTVLTIGGKMSLALGRTIVSVCTASAYMTCAEKEHDNKNRVSMYKYKHINPNYDIVLVL